LINALSKYEHLVLFPVNPNLLAGLRKAFSSSGAKDDPSDAALALDTLLQHPEKLRAWVPEDARTRHLQALVEGRRRLIDARVRITNRLLANLKGYFPQAIDCFEDIGTKLACGFLSEWPSLGEARRAHKATLVRFFHQHGVRDDELIAKRIALLKDGMALTTDGGVILPSVLTTKALVAQLRALLVGISDFDTEIARVFKNIRMRSSSRACRARDRPLPRGCCVPWVRSAIASPLSARCRCIWASPRSPSAAASPFGCTGAGPVRSSCARASSSGPGCRGAIRCGRRRSTRNNASAVRRTMPLFEHWRSSG
jgi:hypothetical protein